MHWPVRTLGRSLVVATVLIILSGCGVIHDLVDSHPFLSIPPDSTGVAWVACRNMINANSSDGNELAEQKYCKKMATKLCDGPAVYLDNGAGLPEENFYRERFQCIKR